MTRRPRRRRRPAVAAAIALGIIVSGGAFAYAGWIALFPPEPDIGCGTYTFPTATWRSALRAQPTDETLTRGLARNVVRCDLAIGRSEREVRRLLGPGEGDRRRGKRPRLEWWSYRVGMRASDDVFLAIEFDRGRAAYVSAPARHPGGRGTDIADGAPIRP